MGELYMCTPLNERDSGVNRRGLPAIRDLKILDAAASWKVVTPERAWVETASTVLKGR